FGTFAISINQTSKLIMSYIISVSTGETINKEIEGKIQSLCSNFGKQLTQFSFIPEYAINGVPIDRSTLIRGFLNAVTIIQMEQELSSDPRKLRREYEKIINDLFEDKILLTDVINDILEDDWIEKEKFWYKGILKPENRENLIIGVAEYIVYDLVNKFPSLMLSSPDPRSEPKRIYQILLKMFKEKNINFEELIIDNFPKDVEYHQNKILSTISILDLHTTKTIIIEKFLKISFLKSFKINPVIIFCKLDQEILFSEFNKKLQNIEVYHIGNVLSEIIIEKQSGVIARHIQTFISEFIKEMSGISLSKTSMNILIRFTNTFILKDELLSKINNFDKLTNQARIELKELIVSEEQTQLQIKSIEEAIILTNAIVNSLSFTISEIFISQFLDIVDKDCILIKNINYYAKNGITIKAASALIEFLKILNNISFDLEFILPRYRDIVSTLMIYFNLNIIIEDQEYVLTKKNNEYFYKRKNDYRSLTSIIEELDTLRLISQNGKHIPINLNKIDSESFIQIINQPEILIEAVKFATERRYSTYVQKVLIHWSKVYISFLTEIKDTLTTAENFKHVTQMIQIKNPILNLKFDHIGNSFQEQLEKLVDEVSAIWTYHCEPTIKEIFQMEKFDKKQEKSLDKLISEVDKKFLSLLKVTDNEFEKIIDKIYSSIKKRKKEFQISFQPKSEEILKYNYDAENLLPTIEEMLKYMKELIDTDPRLASEELQNFPLNISLTLFDNPPESIFEGAFDEIFTDHKSKLVKNALQNAKNKKDFENIILIHGEQETKKIFDGFNSLLHRLNQKFIAKNGIVTTEGGSINLHLGNLLQQKFTKNELLNDLLGFNNVNLKRETDKWLITYSINEMSGINSEDAILVTFLDAIKFYLRTNVSNEFEKLFIALAKVASIVEEPAEKNVLKLFNQFKDIIYPLY
ncbi:MAG: hypothetical protein OEZ01_10840, partial [Candidatus Heimdallarchaeota archaeon]|nr:hypothetical protein [Candidatus Heimdallarchaeota archaeon]